MKGVGYHTAVGLCAPPRPTGRRLLVKYSDTDFKRFHFFPNSDESDPVATGDAEVAAAQLRETMKGSQPKGSTAHNVTDTFDPMIGQSSIGGSTML